MAAASESGLVFNIMRFATHDGPGIRTTVFLKGCPLSCWWCHNPESQSFLPDRLYFEERCRHCLDCVAACPRHAIQQVNGRLRTSDVCTLCGTCAEVCVAEARQIAGRRYNVAELLQEVEKDVLFFDDSGGGVTLSGGEPLSQPGFAAAFLQACRERGIRTTIETCGLAQPAVFLAVALEADLVLFDLKLVDSERHRAYTGGPNEPIFRNLEALMHRGRAVRVRIPVIPGINDSPAEVARFAAYLGHLQAPAVELLPYHRVGTEKYRRLGMDYRLNDTPQPPREDLERFRDVLARAGLKVMVGG